MDGNEVSATQNVLVKMRSILEDLDVQSHAVAAAYVAQAIEVIEGQAAAEREIRV